VLFLVIPKRYVCENPLIARPIKNIRETNELIAHLEASNLVCQLEVEKLEAEALRCQRELENNSNTSCDVPYNIQCDCE